MSGGQEKMFSIPRPKLFGSKAQQYFRDNIRVEVTDYIVFLKYISIVELKCTLLAKYDFHLTKSVSDQCDQVPIVTLLWSGQRAVILP